MAFFLAFAPPGVLARPRQAETGLPNLSPNATSRPALWPVLPRRPLLEIERIGQVAVVKFSRRNILTEDTVEAVAAQLLDLVEEGGHRKLVLNFAHVDRLATAMLGKLITLHKRLRALGGWLVLCRIPPHLYEIFLLLKLPRMLSIYTAEQEALQTFERQNRFPREKLAARPANGYYSSY